MNRIELLGLPGSGKSTLAATLLRAGAVGAESLPAWHVTHTPPLWRRLAARRSQRLREWLAHAARERAHEDFARTHPAFGSAFMLALAEGGEPAVDQAGSISAFQRSAAEWMLARDFPGSAPVVCEEGLVQRVLSAVAFAPREPDAGPLVSSLPDHALVLILRAPPELLHTRIAARSHPPRQAYAGMSTERKLETLAAAGRRLDRVEAALLASGFAVRRVAGDLAPAGLEALAGECLRQAGAAL